MVPDSMRVRLHLRLIRVLTVLVDTPGRLEVEVASTRSWSRCPYCGFKTTTVHDRRRRKIRDLAVSSRRTTWCGSGTGSAAPTATNAISRPMSSSRAA